MKNIFKKVAKKLQRDLKGNDLLEQYRAYFNESRGAKIAIIGSHSTADPTNREIRIRYEDGHDVAIEARTMSWVQLFDKLSDMHPKPRARP